MLNFKFTKGKSINTIVLLHGFMEDLSMWEQSFFPKDFSLLAVDLPGHGASELEVDLDNPSIQVYAEAVKQVIDSTISGKYDIVGHSMGGYVGLELKQLDSKCERLVLYHSNFWVDSEQKKRDRIRVADLVLKNKNLFISEAMPNLFFHLDRNSSVVQNYISKAKNINSTSLAYASLAMRNRKDFTSLCKKWKHELVFIHGESDPLLPLAQVLETVASSPFNLKLLKDAGHMSHVEAPSAVTQIFHELFKHNS